MPVLVKRAYEKASLNDGVRVLVEGAWPRGLSKAGARLDHWMKALAPSQALSKWFEKHAQSPSLRKKYFAELKSPAALQELEMLHQMADGRRPLTLLYSGSNAEVNPATLLRDLIDGRRKPPNGTGPAKAASAKVAARAVRRPAR